LTMFMLSISRKQDARLPQILMVFRSLALDSEHTVLRRYLSYCGCCSLSCLESSRRFRMH
jgi:hypothetical protein